MDPEEQDDFPLLRWNLLGKIKVFSGKYRLLCYTIVVVHETEPVDNFDTLPLGTFLSLQTGKAYITGDYPSIAAQQTEEWMKRHGLPVGRPVQLRRKTGEKMVILKP